MFKLRTNSPCLRYRLSLSWKKILTLRRIQNATESSVVYDYCRSRKLLAADEEFIEVKRVRRFLHPNSSFLRSSADV